MTKVRQSRVGEQIKKELSQLIQQELKDPRIGFLTITGVDVTGDLSQAKVYLSVLGTDEQKKDTLAALAKANGFLRSEIGKRIRLRKVPELLFKTDTSVDYGIRIESLLHQLRREEQHKEGNKEV
jgi:ribosome-binding factor A